MRNTNRLTTSAQSVLSITRSMTGASMLAASMLLLGPAIATAQTSPDTGISGQIKEKSGTARGNTANPTARPDDDGGGIQRKAMKDHPGSTGGTTSSPRAKPDTGSIQGDVMEDHPGVQ